MDKYSIKLDRNNTSFTVHLFEYFKKAKWATDYDFLKYYQNLTRIYVNDIDIDSRGLLISYTMGLGKSILAISIAMDMIKIRQPIVLLTKSLQENMVGSIRKYVKLRFSMDPEYELGKLTDLELNQWISKNFSFVSMNASNMLKQLNRAAEGHSAEEFDAALEKKLGEILKMPSLDGKLLIVDEAHNLFRAITNGSKNAMGLYELVMRARNLKLMFLTGTPISNDPFELVVCLNMLGSKYGNSILPENYKDFKKLFIDETTGFIKNKGKFQNRILGLISYVSHHSTPGKALGIAESATKAEFPEERPVVIVKVHMDPDQYVMYGLARDREKDEGKTGKMYTARLYDIPNLMKPKSFAASTYRVKSRQLSNYCQPPGYRNEKDPAKIPSDKLESAKYRAVLEKIHAHDNQLGLVYSQFVGIGGLGSFSKFLESKGWARVEIGEPKETASDETDEYIEGAEETTSYVEISDIDNYLNDLHNSQIEYTGAEFDISVSLNTKRYAIISGSVDVADRTKIQNLYNSDNNKHGGVIDLLLISSTGAEGLDLKNVRHIHILEPYWNWGRIMQIISRGVRNDSHIALAPEEKNVTPYIYLAIPPIEERGPNGYAETTDTELYNESVSNQASINSFIEAIREVSIECMVNGDNCRVCNPSDQPLYSADIARDIRATDPCDKLKEESISVSEIIYDGKPYYYKKDTSATYDYRIFIYDATINGYRNMKESDPLFIKIIEAIESAA